MCDELILNCQSSSRGPSPSSHRDPSPQPLPDPEDETAGQCVGPHSDQSASEDSSLTDSERFETIEKNSRRKNHDVILPFFFFFLSFRTIVGEAPGDCLAQLSPNSSPADSDHVLSFEGETTSTTTTTNDCSSKRTDHYRSKLIVSVSLLSLFLSFSLFRFSHLIFSFFFQTGLHPSDDCENWDGDDESCHKNFNYFFKAVPYTDKLNQKCN